MPSDSASRSGKPFFAARKKLHLGLAEHRAFASGAVYLRHERAG